MTQLITSGAARHDVWISAKPPGEEIAGLLRRYGITPDEPVDQRPDDSAHLLISADTSSAVTRDQGAAPVGP